MSNVMTVENFEGRTLFIKDFNCGYNGTGPRDTAEILKALGIADEEARRLISINGFQLCFDTNGKYLRGQGMEGLPFESRRHYMARGQVRFISESMVANIPKKQLYFLELTECVYLSLIDTLNLLDIKKMIFYIGEDSSQYYNFSLPYHPSRYRAMARSVFEGPFIFFEGRPFDVICYIGFDCPGSLINALSVYLTGKPVFKENLVGGQTILMGSDNNRSRGWLSSILKLICTVGKQKEIYQTIDIKRNKGTI